jgi:hypothetical protein
MDTKPNSTWLASIAAIDLRSLAAFRIGLGALIFWDQFIALTNVRAFYSDEGVLTRSFLLDHQMINGSLWSLHMLGGSVLVQSVLIMTAMAAAVGVILGWRTRASLAVAWVLVVSLQARNPAVLFGGDTVLRVMAFWGMLLPLGACWSMDSRTYGKRHSGSWLSLASLAILFQVAFIYWFTAALKTGNEWARDGSAVYYVLCADQFVRTPGVWLLHFPELCRALSFGVWWLEMLGPFAAFIPWRTAWWRVLVIAAMAAMHLGFALCLRIGYFPVAMMSLWLLFIPRECWDWLGMRWTLLAMSHDGLPSLSIGRRFVTEVVAGLCLLLVLLWNLWTTDAVRWGAWLPKPVTSVGYALRLDQNWALFAPTPVTDDGWMLLEAELYDGRRIDLLREGQTLDFAKPYRISAEYPDWKWHKLEVNLVASGYQSMRRPFGDFLAKQWSEQHAGSARVRNWTLWFVREQSLPHYMAIEPQRVKLEENRLFVAP